MKKKIIGYFISCMIIVFVHAQQIRTVQSFNKGWKFYLGNTNGAEKKEFDDGAWRSLQLPHDWSIEGTFDKNHPAGIGGGALPGGMGWYRKSFALPASAKDKVILVDFDGVYCNSEVWINGHYLGKRPNGYISFRYDISNYVRFGNEKNVITVKVDNAEQPNSRWYSGSGIYRNVWLTIANKTHIDYNGIFITTPEITSQQARVNVKTRVRTLTSGNQSFILNTSIYTATGVKVAFTATKHNREDVNQDLIVKNPALWSVDKPALYKAISTVSVNGKVVDNYTTSFGIRSFRFDVNKGFFLNGKHLKIRGVCNHHDLGCLGAAINYRGLERQLEILKEMGCNAIRTSHNPPAPELLDLCDKMGFLVMDEAFDMWAKVKSKFDYHRDWKEWHKKDLEDFVKRDRNHPSVIMWSVGNEIPEQWGNDTSGAFISRELVGIVKSLDTTRPVLTANNEINSYNNILKSGAMDITGYNYNHERWDSVFNTWPGKPFIVTESTSALETRGFYDMPSDSIRRWPKRWDIPLTDGNPEHYVSAYDNVSAPWGSLHEESLRELEKYDHVSGMFIWTGFDYLGEPTPYEWPSRSSYFGIIDLAGFPKDVFYLYKSVWTNKPVLHVFPHWNWTKGKDVDVWAYYNNADEVELFLNGKSLGKKSKGKEESKVVWRVPFEAGTIKAVSTKNGKTVLVKEIHTASAASKISLSVDRKTIKADGQDLCFVSVAILDNKGNLVPDAVNNIQFSVEGGGKLVGVDNGDPTSPASFKADNRNGFFGRCLAVVQSNALKQPIILKATADGLSSAIVIIAVK